MESSNEQATLMEQIRQATEQSKAINTQKKIFQEQLKAMKASSPQKGKARAKLVALGKSKDSHY